MLANHALLRKGKRSDVHCQVLALAAHSCTEDLLLPKLQDLACLGQAHGSNTHKHTQAAGLTAISGWDDTTEQAHNWA